MVNKLREELELKEDISNLISNIRNIEEEYTKVLDKYAEDVSVADKKQEDILHYLEFNNLNTVAAYRLVKELQEVREERRKAKDNIDLLNRISLRLKFNDKDKSINKILESKEQQLRDRSYKMKYYSEKEIKNIANLPIYKEVNQNG